jgi:transcriptional regulator with XRE-family HTH domain
MMLGERVHTRRSQLDLTLRDLAERCGLTASFLSQVERDLVSPSIGSLRQIASALDVPIFYFLADEPARSPVVRSAERRRLTLPNPDVTYELLTPGIGGKMEVFICRLPAGSGNVARPMPGDTEECLLVLEGSIDVQLEGQNYRLATGDSMCFNGIVLKSLSNPGEVEAVFVSSITPPVF